MGTRRLNINQLVRLPELQVRSSGTSAEHTEDLARALKSGKNLPPIRVREITEAGDNNVCGLVVTDGFHTIDAHAMVGKKQINAVVVKGNWNDAVKDAAAANQKHLALKMTHSDKKRAIEMILEVEPEWSDRRIAEHLGISHDFVSKMRGQSSTGRAASSSSSERVGKDNKKRKAKHQAPAKRQTPTAEDDGVAAGDGKEPATRKLADGKAIYDWKAFDAHYGWLVRSLDALGTIFGQQNSKEHRALLGVLSAFGEGLTKWHDKLTANAKTDATPQPTKET